MIKLTSILQEIQIKPSTRWVYALCDSSGLYEQVKPLATRNRTIIRSGQFIIPIFIIFMSIHITLTTLIIFMLSIITSSRLSEMNSLNLLTILRLVLYLSSNRSDPKVIPFVTRYIKINNFIFLK